MESRREYEVSFSKFKDYSYDMHKIVLGSNCVFQIDLILSRLNTHLGSFVHYKFINVTTLGFKGDSIIESSNQSVKNGPFSVASRMQMDQSAIAQSKKIEYLSAKRDTHNATSVAMTALWINSDIEKLLTPYAAGLGCAMWDRRNHYYACMNEVSESRRSFYVIAKTTFDLI